MECRGLENGPSVPSGAFGPKREEVTKVMISIRAHGTIWPEGANPADAPEIRKHAIGGQNSCLDSGRAHVAVNVYFDHRERHATMWVEETLRPILCLCSIAQKNPLRMSCLNQLSERRTGDEYLLRVHDLEMRGGDMNSAQES
jgi:hypothetical protein